MTGGHRPGGPDNAHITPSDITAEDSARVTAEEEAVAFSRQDYDTIQLKRRLNFHKHVHWVKLGFLYCISAAYFVAAVIWMLHLLAPESWHFMPAENYTTLQNLLFGSIIGGLANQFAHRIFRE